MFTPSKSQNSLLFGLVPLSGGFLLSILASKRAALTFNHCTQHCVPVSHLHVPHQVVTPTRFSTVFQVSSCSTRLLMARTVENTATSAYDINLEYSLYGRCYWIRDGPDHRRRRYALVRHHPCVLFGQVRWQGRESDRTINWSLIKEDFLFMSHS